MSFHGAPVYVAAVLRTRASYVPAGICSQNVRLSPNYIRLRQQGLIGNAADTRTVARIVRKSAESNTTEATDQRQHFTGEQTRYTTAFQF